MSAIPAWAPQWYHHVYAQDPRRGMELWARHRRTERRRIQSDRAFERTRDIRGADDLAMLVCGMRADSVLGKSKEECRQARACFVCGGPLPERRLYWCSDECVQTWTTNHEWTAARRERVRLDDEVCVRCGLKAGPTGDDRCELDDEPWPCAAVVANPDPRRDVPDDYYRSDAYQAWLVARRGHWKKVGVVVLEVNHRIPRNGLGYHQGCHHHLSLLESVCHACHVAETNQQRADREAGVERHVDPGPPPAAVKPRSLVAHDPGSTLGMPSAGAWDVAS